MTGTTRTNYEGETILDGEHGKKCPVKHCESGVHGAPKVAARRAARRTQGRTIRAALEGNA